MARPRAKSVVIPANGVRTPPPIDPLAPGQVMVHDSLALIEVDDPADLTALLSDPRIAPLLLARISDHAAVALPGAAPWLLLELTKAGHTPTIEGEP
jgi:hypothetical protein